MTDNWEVRKVKDLFNLGRGRVISSIEIATHQGKYPVFSSQSRDNGCMGHIDTFDFEGEYVTWTTDGANAGTVFYRNGQFNCTNVCGTLKAKDTLSIDHRFMAFQLGQQAKRHVSYIGNPKLMNGVMAEIQLQKPPYPEQKVISTILDTVAEAIAAAEAQLAKQEKIKQGLLQDLLTRGIDETGLIRPHWEDRPDLYKKTELGFLPTDWEVKTIDSLTSYVGSGVTPRGGSEVYKTSGILFIRSQNVTFEGLKLSDVAYIDETIHEDMQSSAIHAHDVLLNITGASIGRCCPVPEMLGTANVNQHVCAIRLPKPNKQDASYLSLVLSSFIGQDQIARLNAGGNREGLNYQQIRTFFIPWPNDLERKHIVENFALQKDEVNSGVKELEKLKMIKTGLMQDLLTGQRRVTPELIRQVETLTGSS